MKPLAVPNRQRSKNRLTQPGRLFKHGVEHRSEVTGRRVDDLQYLGGRGLPLQGLSRLGQEARILHCNDRLRREVLQQSNLFLRERTHLTAIDYEGAQQRLILSQGNPNRSARSA